ncbi:foldase protein PrsA [Breznakia sp. PF5-3]|uniref:peptidylprolyl isomerase n=1 Tax=unclassified Breznakia TaxID=2623764 RepID=UPI002404CC23|nr:MULTISPECIES: peptidylprolyl isomerase [unclassified Breznakia]MDF9823710.1 foldase protein PrsA [Breznakia sp. PM6-1]MDF9834508.1 foldase protein PrsA [Breznakia sp. PF5-3]MDF9837521.1 foldase protein PrsA [Breznakia sp. PFB2-8]MDF9859098.1 foldase protein PrsA [Breznakia sp. PH5-24]
MNYNIKEILKKFWFVILVGAIFVSMAIFFAWDTNKDTIAAKSSKGKDVIFTLANKNYTADEYYKALFENASGDNEATSGVQLTYTLIERNVIEQSVKTTDKMEETANNNFKTMEASYKSGYGDNYETYITSQLKQLGYDGVDDFEQYFLDQEKAKKLVSDYINDHKDLFDEVYEKSSPRVISHILVKMSDPANPSETEKARMAEIEKALEKDSFGKVAKKYSDDEGSAKESGSLGIQLKSGTLVEEFKNAAWKLESGEVSQWVKTEYGYHLIKVVTTDKKKMLKEDKYNDSLVSAIQTYYPNLKKQIVWEKAKKLKIEVKDKDLKADLLKYIGVEK